jgi:hypothetical protein
MFFDHLGHFDFGATQIKMVDDFLAATCKTQCLLKKESGGEWSEEN